MSCAYSLQVGRWRPRHSCLACACRHSWLCFAAYFLSQVSQANSSGFMPFCVYPGSKRPSAKDFVTFIDFLMRRLTCQASAKMSAKGLLACCDAQLGSLLIFPLLSGELKPLLGGHFLEKSGLVRVRQDYLETDVLHLRVTQSAKATSLRHTCRQP